MPGVDGFWSDASIEPKRKFRWLLSFRGVPQWIMKKVGKPNFSLGEAEHSFLNYKFYYPGRVEWSEISMTLVDPVSPDASRTMMALLKQSGYVPPHNFLNANNIPDTQGLEANRVYTMSKAGATKALGGAIYIQQIDSNGRVNEEWKLYNPFIKSVSFDELDYESDDLLNIELTLRYDWADLTGRGSGLIASELDKKPSALAAGADFSAL